MRDYVRFLIQKFDGNSDGIISIDELSNGVKFLNIHLTLREKQSLMTKLDLNKDGEITAEELYMVLSKTDTKMNKAQLDTTLE